MQNDIMKIATNEEESAAIAKIQNPSPIDYFCEEEIERMDECGRKGAGITRAGWYFWNETWTDAYGPYSCRLEAEIALQKYCTHLEDQRNSPI